MTNKKIVIIKKSMPVKNGEAWAEKSYYRKRRPTRHKWKVKDWDGVIRTHKSFMFCKRRSETGYCPECQQMPCPHTAELLGWTTNDS